MIYEFCAENITLIEQAMEAGAKRIELCDNLAVGGTTPSYGGIQTAVRLAKLYDSTVMTMIRPRGGNFVHTDLEIEIMLQDVHMARQAGSQGLVFGLLTADYRLDTVNLEKLIYAANGKEIVFHMAFDSIPVDQQFRAMDWLADHGVKRILTRAGNPDTDLERRFERYKELIEAAQGRIEILPGGGIGLSNRNLFMKQLGVDQLHGTKVVF